MADFGAFSALFSPPLSDAYLEFPAISQIIILSSSQLKLPMRRKSPSPADKPFYYMIEVQVKYRVRGPRDLLHSAEEPRAELVRAPASRRVRSTHASEARKRAKHECERSERWERGRPARSFVFMKSWKKNRESSNLRI
jgi:hypothetical protein